MGMWLRRNMKSTKSTGREKMEEAIVMGVGKAKRFSDKHQTVTHILHGHDGGELELCSGRSLDLRPLELQH